MTDRSKTFKLFFLCLTLQALFLQESLPLTHTHITTQEQASFTGSKSDGFLSSLPLRQTKKRKHPDTTENRSIRKRNGKNRNLTSPFNELLINATSQQQRSQSATEIQDTETSPSESSDGLITAPNSDDDQSTTQIAQQQSASSTVSSQPDYVTDTPATINLNNNQLSTPASLPQNMQALIFSLIAAEIKTINHNTIQFIKEKFEQYPSFDVNMQDEHGNTLLYYVYANHIATRGNVTSLSPLVFQSREPGAIINHVINVLLNRGANPTQGQQSVLEIPLTLASYQDEEIRHPIINFFQGIDDSNSQQVLDAITAHQDYFDQDRIDKLLSMKLYHKKAQPTILQKIFDNMHVNPSDSSVIDSIKERSGRFRLSLQKLIKDTNVDDEEAIFEMIYAVLHKQPLQDKTVQMLVDTWITSILHS